MDCFSVSITCGILQKRMGRQVWAMALLFGLFQGGMPLVGWLLSSNFLRLIEAYDHWVAFGLLLFLGGKMIWEGMHDDGENPHYNPSRLGVLLMLSVATSIDALAVGVSYPGIGMKGLRSVLEASAWIAVVSFAMSVIGKFIGVKVGCRFNWPAEQVGGVILILIGLKVLCTG